MHCPSCFHSGTTDEVAQHMTETNHEGKICAGRYEAVSDLVFTDKQYVCFTCGNNVVKPYIPKIPYNLPF